MLPFAPEHALNIAEGAMTQARDLADRFHGRSLRIHPFTATMYGPILRPLIPPAADFTALR